MMHLEALPPMKAQSVPLAGGDAGIAQTIRAMNQLIDQGKKDPEIHELAAKIITARRVPPDYDPRSALLRIRAIGEWVGRNILYTRDVTGKETLHGAREVVRLKIGDCDDFTILICSMLGTIGIPCRIVTISSHSLDPSQFTHVFPEAKAGHRWIPVDFARRNPAFGKGPEHWARRREWSTTSDEYEDVAGLGTYGGRPVTLQKRLAGSDLNAAATWAGSAGRRFRLGYNPNALPNAYTTKALPRFRRSKAIAPMGMGHYGSRALSALAQDDGFNWASLVPAITAATTGTANIITAERATPANLYPTTAVPGQASAMFPGLSPYGYPSSSLLSPAGTIGGIQLSTLLLAGLGIAAIAALRR
jgi:Transglutaminase-like superfamily